MADPSEDQRPRPFLKKGQGTARFRGPPATRKPLKPMTSPRDFQQFPRFTPSIPPSSARTDFDSGISNEGASPFGEIDNDDDTRPPTMASLPLDSPKDRHFSVLEEKDLDQDEEEEGEDQEGIESISAKNQKPIPSFVADSACSEREEEEEEEGVEGSIGSTPVSTNCSALSNQTKQDRQLAKKARDRADHIDMQGSLSTMTSSTMSAPLGASTPIDNNLRQTPNNYESTSFPSTSMPGSGQQFHHDFQTPISQNNRPFSSNRVNLIPHRDDVAQTGMSLIQRPATATAAAPYENVQNLRHRAHFQNLQQKENVPTTTTHHVYDLPRREKYTKAEKNLMIQLRDTIAHLDYAEEQTRKTAEKITEEYKKLKAKLTSDHANMKKELSADYEKKFEAMEEERRQELEKIQRDRRDIERDRRILQKDSGEKTKEHLKLIEEQRSKLANNETQLAKLRLDVRKSEEKLKKREEELEKQTKEMDRLKKNNLIMEKRLRQMRSEQEKKEKEEEMFAKAAMKNKTAGYCSNSSCAVQKKAPKNVKWAEMAQVREISSNRETQVEEEEEEREEDWVMKPVQKGQQEWGAFILYRNLAGNMTRETKTLENGLLYEYADGSQRWVNAQSTFQIDIGAPPTSATQIYVARSNTCIRFFKNRQFEIMRPHDQISLVNYRRNQVRTEVMKSGQYYYTEIFDKDGRVTIRDGRQEDVTQRYNIGEQYSKRDGGSRYVHVTNFDDFEFIEPEFRLRWYKGEQIVCKIFMKKFENSNDLRLEICPTTNQLKMEAVQGYSPINRISQKKTVWMTKHHEEVTK